MDFTIWNTLSRLSPADWAALACGTIAVIVGLILYFDGRADRLNRH